jgi:hypothetical protein
MLIMKKYLLQQDDVGIEGIVSILPSSQGQYSSEALEEAAAQLIEDNDYEFNFENDCERKIEVICQELDNEEEPLDVPPIKINVYVEEHKQFSFWGLRLEPLSREK